MKRCNDCASRVYDSDSVCTACRMLEWKDQVNNTRTEQARRNAIDAANTHYYAKRKSRQALMHNIVRLILVAIAVVAICIEADRAMEYDLVTKPAMLKANGVR
jgi:hypothetical protein